MLKKFTVHEVKEEFVHFKVSGNGIGIRKNNQERIFDIFQRMHNKSEYKGTGIGQAHYKKIVEIHSGKIWAESKIGEGSYFNFTLKK